MYTTSLPGKLFATAAALLVGGVALTSAPALAYAGDAEMDCPGTRCSGRIEPICCQRTYWVTDEHGRILENQFYYFANAT